MKLFRYSPFEKILILKQRSLALGEKQLAYSVFGQALKLDDIQIIAHRLVLKNYAISPNGHIYFHPNDWCEDFSTRSLGQQSWLIHELTHVWQIQQGIDVVRKALVDRRYSYVLEHGKSFLSYGIEQQAQMVQDYFIKMNRGEQCFDLAACLPFVDN